jgi:hypothetical protein
MDDAKPQKPVPVAPPQPPLVYHLVRALCQGHGEQGYQNTNISFCPMVNYSVSFGPDPGHGDDDYGMTLTLHEMVGPGMKMLHRIRFEFEDNLPARHIAQALTAWADWVDEMNEAENAKAATGKNLA